MKQALLIFSKNLIYGEVKTRLALTVGDDKALSVYKYLLQHTVSVCEKLPVDKIVFYSRYIDMQDGWSNEVYKKQVQSGDDLGERMENSFHYAFSAGFNQTVIIGTDCFDITTAIILKAFEKLKDHDVVIGPAIDGGYYLLGMKQPRPLLFYNILWSTGEVLQKTLAICKIMELHVYQLPELKDIDREDDLNDVQKQMLNIK
ncbi:MAG: TIGR04282 family arsenosugar biosynthesis glycosyltransferase [Ferruginibacter sp.]